MKNLLVLSYLFLIIPQVIGQLKRNNIHHFDSIQKKQSKTSVIFIHTDWCRYCKQMKNNTLSDTSIIFNLNHNFNYYELNGELKDQINIQGIVFNYIATGNNTGTHELAYELGNIEGTLEYPTIVFIDNQNKVIGQYSGLITAKELAYILMNLAPE